MRRKAILFVAVMASVLAQAGNINPALQVKEFKLSNGMTVWLNEDHSQPKVFGAVVVKAGAKDCPNTGIAHYFEHIMFKGTDRIGTVDYQAEKPWLDSISVQYDLLSQTQDEAEHIRIQQHINELSLKAADYMIPNEFNHLIKNVREFRSLAYTTSGSSITTSLALHPQETNGYITGTGTQADKTIECIATIDSLLRQMPMKEENLEASRQTVLNDIQNDYTRSAI